MQPIFYVGFLVSLLMHLVNKEFQQSSFYGKHQSVISLKLLCQDQEIHDGVPLQTGLWICFLLTAGQPVIMNLRPLKHLENCSED